MGYFGDTPQDVAEQIARDVSSMADPEAYALAYAYMCLEDVNYHTENRNMEARFGQIDTVADDVMSSVYYDFTNGSTFDWDPDVAFELAIIVAERNHPKLASWLKRVP